MNEHEKNGMSLNPHVRMAQRSNQDAGGVALAAGPRASLNRVWRRLAPARMREGWRRYQLAHRRQMVEGLDKLIQQPISSLFIVLVLGVTLALPAGATLVFAKVWQVANVFQPEPRAQVYFRPQTPLTTVQAYAKR